MRTNFSKGGHLNGRNAQSGSPHTKSRVGFESIFAKTELYLPFFMTVPFKSAFVGMIGNYWTTSTGMLVIHYQRMQPVSANLKISWIWA